jgi:hypothetical protein
MLLLVLAGAVGWLPMAAPQHLHESEEHGHQRLALHRHHDMHGLVHAHAPGNVAVHEDDAPAVTLEVAYAAPARPAQTDPPSIVPFAAPEATIAGALYRTPDYLGQLIHGPPRGPTGLRAPPALSRL